MKNDLYKNKGFSLVELIIVIAIMAILAAAIAPAVIRYIDKSRHATDVESADEIARCIANELLADDLEFGDDPSFKVTVDGTGTKIEAVNIPNASDHIHKVFEGLNITNYNPPGNGGGSSWTCTSTELKCKSIHTYSTATGDDGNGNETSHQYIVEMKQDGSITKNIYYLP
jgi:prepilin-type N-terminal cleavage/methylation domain